MNKEMAPMLNRTFASFAKVYGKMKQQEQQQSEENKNKEDQK